MTTKDRWSMEETRQTTAGTLNFKPYSAFKLFAVFLNGNVVYDGPDEGTARKIFNQYAPDIC